MAERARRKCKNLFSDCNTDQEEYQEVPEEDLYDPRFSSVN